MTGRGEVEMQGLHGLVFLIYEWTLRWELIFMVMKPCYIVPGSSSRMLEKSRILNVDCIVRGI